MKCISCGSEIPEGSTSCPFCGNTVLPTNQNVVNDAPVNNVVPTTPETPVLPQDQNLGQVPNPAPEASENQGVQVANPVPNPTPTPMENTLVGGSVEAQTPSENAQVGDVSTPNPMPSPVMEGNNPSPVQPSTPVPGGENLGVNPGPVVAPTSNPGVVSGEGAPVPPMPPMPEAQVNMAPQEPQTISNQGELGDGAKIASTAAPVIEKKSKKKLVIIILIIVAIIAIAAGIGIYYYMSQYKSADKRIDAIFSQMNKYATSLKAENIESKSGTYNFGLSLAYDTTSFNAKVDGKYAYDLEKKIIDFGVNVSELSMKNDGEDIDLIDKDPLAIELYMADSKLYVLLENFYENYIYTDIDEYDDLFDGIEQNDINYPVIAQAFINAVKNGLKAADNTQTVKEVTFNGNTQKANVITIVLNKETRKKITTTSVNSLKNNTTALEEMAKITTTSAEEIKSLLEELLEDEDYSDEKETIEIVTDTKGTSLIGIRVYDDASTLEIATITNGYKVSYKENNKDVFNLTYTSLTTTNSTVKETTTTFELTGYDDDDKLIKISLESTLTDDINPSVEKVNTKNSVNMNNISSEDQQKIVSNILDYGNLGLLLQGMLGSYTTTAEDIYSYDAITYDDYGMTGITTSDYDTSSQGIIYDASTEITSY